MYTNTDFPALLNVHLLNSTASAPYVHTLYASLLFWLNVHSLNVSLTPYKNTCPSNVQLLYVKFPECCNPV